MNLVLAAVQVQVEVPDVQGRLDILKVHAKNKKLAEDVNLESVAMRVPGPRPYGSLIELQYT
jgi:ATP-dependent Zn protease